MAVGAGGSRGGADSAGCVGIPADEEQDEGCDVRRRWALASGLLVLLLTLALFLRACAYRQPPWLLVADSDVWIVEVEGEGVIL